MDEMVTKEDLRQFGLILMNDIRKALEAKNSTKNSQYKPEWLKSRKVRSIMDMSPGTLQNLRVTGQVRYKKVLGSYYYNRTDLQNLFSTAHEYRGNK